VFTRAVQETLKSEAKKKAAVPFFCESLFPARFSSYNFLRGLAVAHREGRRARKDNY
jgi:hypothetical protein